MRNDFWMICLSLAYQLVLEGMCMQLTVERLFFGFLVRRIVK